MKSLISVLVFSLLLPVSSQASSSPVGYVDNIDSNGTVYGWAKDPDAPNTAIGVHVYTGSTFLGAVTASWFHDSVAGYHGFRFTLPENIRGQGPYPITVYGIDVVGGNPNAAIQNGNPYPTAIGLGNVSNNDNCREHDSGWPYQNGTMVGGRPNNNLAAYSAKAITSPNWQGQGLAWFQEGFGAIRINCAPRIGGAVSSIIWDNVEFIDSAAHGTALQYIEHDTLSGELYNPTEAGSNVEDSWAWYSTSLVNLRPLTAAQNPTDPITGSHLYRHGSSSSIQLLVTGSGVLNTKCRPAFWAPRSPYPQYGAYPKPANTIYTANLCRGNPRANPPTVPPNPPGYNANSAFYSDFGPKPFNTTPTTATHSVAAPDSLDNALYDGVDAITDFVMEKTIKLGVPGHAQLNNLMIFEGNLTIPADAPSPGDYQLALYPDHIRFHANAGSRTLIYNPATGAETNITTSPSGVTNSAVIAIGAGNRYAIGFYTRQPNTRMFWIQSSTQGANAYISFGCSTNQALTAGTIVPLTSYVLVGTLYDVETSLRELYGINPAP